MSIVIPELDSKDIDMKTRNCGHNVNYVVYTSKSDDYIIPPNEQFKKSDIVVHVCFASLMGRLSKVNPPHNRMMYYIRKRAVSPLTDKEMIQFLDLSQKNGAVPDYVDIKKVVKRKKFVLKIEPSLPNDLIYTYLTVARMLEEEVGFVRNMIVLSDKYKMPYGLAWVAASKLSISNSHHNIVSIGVHGEMYGDNTDDNPLNSKIDLVKALAITKYLKERPKKPHDVSRRQGPFNTNTTITKYAQRTSQYIYAQRINQYIKVSEAFDNNIYEKFDKI